MKLFYKLSGNVQSKPSRLFLSIMLSFLVMTFVNGFIGGVGGFPVFLSFGIVFYQLRNVMGEGNRLTHQMAMTSRREIVYWMRNYCVGYLLLWLLLRLVFLFSRVTGWGNISGASALEYFRNLIAVSMFEKWAYLFVGVLMFAFIVSLFPLTVIAKTEHWVLYVLVDGAIFSLVCLVIEQIGYYFTKTKSSCVIDSLLLCNKMKAGQEAAWILGIVLFALLVCAASYGYAVRCYGPKKGRTDAAAIQMAQRQKPIYKGKGIVHNVVVILCGITAVCVVTGIVFFMPEDTAGGYVKVAEFLTGDEVLGPMLYEDQVYIPVNEQLNLDETGTAKGYLAGEKENCNSRFYQLAVANLLYTDDTKRTNRVQMEGAKSGVYAPVTELEQKDAWEKDDVFLLWDEEWVSESTYSHEPTGYTACNADFIKGLTMQFPQVNYHAEDFEDYDAYFTIRGYSDMDTVMMDDTIPGDWVGCILVKDNKFYFGSYENRITGISLQELLDILGGY